MGRNIGSNAEGLRDSLSDVETPEVAELCRKLKRYVEAERGIQTQLKATLRACDGVQVDALALKTYIGKQKNADIEAFKNCSKDFDLALDRLEKFSDALEKLLQGDGPGKVTLPGEALDSVLDKLEFKEKASENVLSTLQKGAKAFYPAESAAQKRLAEWSVHLKQLALALNEGLATLDRKDKVQDLNLNFGRMQVLKPALELKKGIDAMGI